VWTGESGYFLSDDVKRASSISLNNKPIWRQNVDGEQSKFPATISLYGACSEDILVQRSLGYYSESGYHRIRVHGRIRFEYATCGREIYVSGKKKLRIQGLSLCSTLLPDHGATFVYSGDNNVIFLALPAILPPGAE